MFKWFNCQSDDIIFKLICKQTKVESMSVVAQLRSSLSQFKLKHRALAALLKVSYCQTAVIQPEESKSFVVRGTRYQCDEWTNVKDNILSKVNRNLHLQRHHPLNHIKQLIVDYMYAAYLNNSRSPSFSVYDNLDPVVTVQQNFDSLLLPHDHPSRARTDTYYLNVNHVLRTHTTAHQAELIKCGLDNFVVIGDVYRKDEIDRSHYPVFHQVDALRLCSKHQLIKDVKCESLEIFENGRRTSDKQEVHTLDAVKIMEQDLKNCLLGLAQRLFGEGIEYRWVDSYFPFTHPSYELEIGYQGDWMEILGCGIVENQILQKAGAGDRIGWAFGLGLERLAMKLYSIPDIRVFWSQDSGVLSQFQVDDPYTSVTYKEVSVQPQGTLDMAFWISDKFNSNDFYELVRRVGGDLVEIVSLVDEFWHPKLQKKSHCYRITYRSMERPLTIKEMNVIHKEIGKEATKDLGVSVRT